MIQKFFKEIYKKMNKTISEKIKSLPKFDDEIVESNLAIFLIFIEIFSEI